MSLIMSERSFRTVGSPPVILTLVRPKLLTKMETSLFMSDLDNIFD